jgi:hypothetical protein
MVDAIMGFIDIYPTIKRIVGVTDPDPNPLDGQDSLDVIPGKNLPPKRDWFSYVSQGKPEQAALSEGTWKLVIRGVSTFNVNPEDIRQGKILKDKISFELFRLDRDASKKQTRLKNTLKSPPNFLKRLKEFLRQKVEGLPRYNESHEGFKPSKDWIICDFSGLRPESVNNKR